MKIFYLLYKLLVNYRAVFHIWFGFWVRQYDMEPEATLTTEKNGVSALNLKRVQDSMKQMNADQELL